MLNDDVEEREEVFYPVFATAKGMPEVRGYVEISTGKTFWEQLDNDDWLYVGHVKMPKNKMQWFLHDLFHGLAMGYPFFEVVFFAVTHLTKRALDGGDGVAFQALSIPEVLSAGEADSTPAHRQ